LPGNSRPGPSVEGGSGGMACWQRGRGGSQAGALAGADAGPVGWPPGLRSRGGICPFDGGTDMGAFSTRQLARYLDRGPARWVGARASRQGQPANRQLWSGVAFPGRGFRGGCFGQSHTRLGSPFKGPCRREGVEEPQLLASWPVSRWGGSRRQGFPAQGPPGLWVKGQGQFTQGPRCPFSQRGSPGDGEGAHGDLGRGETAEPRPKGPHDFPFSQTTKSHKKRKCHSAFPKDGPLCMVFSSCTDRPQPKIVPRSNF
jgi:hypothetical protein